MDHPANGGPYDFVTESSRMTTGSPCYTKVKTFVMENGRTDSAAISIKMFVQKKAGKTAASPDAKPYALATSFSKTRPSIPRIDPGSCIIRHRQTKARSGIIDQRAGSAEAVCAERST